VRWLLTAWQLVRDIGLTSLGAWLLVTQSQSQHADSTLIWVAYGLLLPAAGSHIAALLSSVIGSGQLPSSPRSSESSSTPESPGGTREGHGGAGDGNPPG
jgi:hypothetical protein